MKRRDFLKFGAALAAGLRPELLGAQQPPAMRLVKSVIWLWMDGAPNPLETWDPKPELPGARGVKAIETNVPGVFVAETLPRCAAIMDRLSLIRSVTHQETESEASTSLMHAGQYPSCWDFDIAVGSLLAYELWRRDAGIPPYLAIDAPSIPESRTMGDLFVPVRLQDAPPEIRRRPGEARWELLDAQDRSWGALRQQRTVSRHAEMRTVASDWMKSGMREAFEVSREPEELRTSYGEGFGAKCLLARRLVQAGSAVVEVGHRGWEADPKKYCREMDAGISALILDLAAKDLLKDTVVFVGSEGGRSPWDSTKRWNKGFSVVLAGGHLRGGRVHGETSPDGTNKDPVPLWNLFATLFQACGVDSNKKYETDGRKVKYVSQNGSVSTSGTPLKAFF